MAGGGGGRGRGARVAAPAGDSGKGAQAEWLRIYDGIVAMLRKTQAQVEELVAERDHLAAFVKIQHDFMVSRVGRLQSSLQQVSTPPSIGPAPSSLLGFFLRWCRLGFWWDPRRGRRTPSGRGMRRPTWRSLLGTRSGRPAPTRRLLVRKEPLRLRLLNRFLSGDFGAKSPPFSAWSGQDWRLCASWASASLISRYWVLWLLPICRSQAISMAPGHAVMFFLNCCFQWMENVSSLG